MLFKVADLPTNALTKVKAATDNQSAPDLVTSSHQKTKVGVAGGYQQGAPVQNWRICVELEGG